MEDPNTLENKMEKPGENKSRRKKKFVNMHTERAKAERDEPKGVGGFGTVEKK